MSSRWARFCLGCNAQASAMPRRVSVTALSTVCLMHIRKGFTPHLAGLRKARRECESTQ